MDAAALRLARPADGELIAALIAEHTAHAGATALARPEAYAAGLGDGAFECLLAERGGEPLGMAMFYPTFSSWSGERGLFLEDLYVRAAARSLGVGRLLLAELARIAGARGATRLDLVVQRSNGARDFYAHRGLRELPEWHLWRADAAVLARLADER